MRILITNDDGVHAAGLEVLTKIAGELSDDVWVVVPETEQSGAGHSLTLTQPLRYREVTERRFAVQGTPTDCVMLALHLIIPGKAPDLLLSGVNRGANMAEDVTYSGTIAGAMEGTLAGIPSIALSQSIDLDKGEICWQASQSYGARVVRQLLEQGWPAEVLININFPRGDASSVKGVRVTEQGRRDMAGLDVISRVDARGFPYYWFALSRSFGKPGHETDLKTVRDDYISVTPLHLDLTHMPTRERMRKALNSEFENS